MENPESWNLLIASLNAAEAERDPEMAWAFLLVQGLVKSSPARHASFVALTQALSEERRRQGNMAGPTFGSQLAQRLSAMTLPAGRHADPFGKIAKKRWDASVAWRKTPGK
ncbi:MAG: hypothetical protein H7Z41_18675 [Cytophagales bacterium]|nr:hypothetical protein [Armatimonadota bacterium]